MAISDSTLQMMLARDSIFLNRLNYLMLQHARVVKEEDAETPHHRKRTAYATQVLSSSGAMVAQAAYSIVGGVNLIGTVELADSGVVTTADDAAIYSQVATFWNVLAGVDSADDPNATVLVPSFPAPAFNPATLPPPFGAK